MRRSTVGIIMNLALGCLVAPRVPAAQQPGKVYRVGVLHPGSATSSGRDRTKALRNGLRELGYVEGQNLTLEVCGAEGKTERLADLAAELVRLPVDLIVTYGEGVGVARRTTTTLPIVAMDLTRNPVEAGLMESLARPGGNITGSFWSQPEIVAKCLELLKEAVPDITQVAVFLGAASPGSPATQAVLAALEHTARELRVELHPIAVDGPDAAERALSAPAHAPGEAIVFVNPLVFTQDPARLARLEELVIAKRLPTIWPSSRGPSVAGLMHYGVLNNRSWRRTAVFVDKILKGARPGDLPMEHATDYELSIDLKIAQELGLTMPESLLLRADIVYPVSGVPLPADLRIVPPDRRVAPALAAFSGK
jgi:putative ABC transport system substrate-binding protein